MAQKKYILNNFSGGLSDSVLFGIKGSIAEGVGLDIHSQPGILNVSQALTKNSGSTVDTLPLFAVNCSNGASYWFGDSAAIKKRLANGTWSSISTGLVALGAVLGACEWMGYIYFATATALHKMAVANDAITGSIQTLDTATWHPMVTQGLYLIIGNATKIATIDDASVFTASGTPDITGMTTLPSYLQVSCLEKFQSDVIIGTVANANTPHATIFRWDTVSPTWIDFKDIPENGALAFIPVDNYLVIQAGNQGQFYYYDGSTIQKYRKISGTYASSTMQTYPGSVCVFRGIAMVGISNKSGNPCLEGVYSIGQRDNSYALATMLEYVPSPNITSGLQIGAMLAVGTTLLVAWKKEADGGTYGVDAIDWNAKYNGAYFKTLAVTGDESKNKTFQEYVLNYTALPASTSLALSYDKNYAGSFTSLTLAAETSYNKYFCKSSFEANTAQFKITFTTSANTAPALRAFYCIFNERDLL